MTNKILTFKIITSRDKRNQLHYSPTIIKQQHVSSWQTDNNTYNIFSSLNIIKYRRAAVCDNEAANYLEVTISNYYLHIHVNKAEKHDVRWKSVWRWMIEGKSGRTRDEGHVIVSLLVLQSSEGLHSNIIIIVIIMLEPFIFHQWQNTKETFSCDTHTHI